MQQLLKLVVCKAYMCSRMARQYLCNSLETRQTGWRRAVEWRGHCKVGETEKERKDMLVVSSTVGCTPQVPVGQQKVLQQQLVPHRAKASTALHLQVRARKNSAPGMATGSCIRSYATDTAGKEA